MAASTITRSALTNGSTPWNVSTVNSAIYDRIDELFGGVGTYATLELGGALKINGALTQLTNDGGALGTTSLGWSDLFLASGGVINWNVGDVTITHSTNTLTFGGAASGYIFNDGNVGLGVTPGNVKLDIVDITAIRTGNSTSNATTKESKYVFRHYTNAEEDVMFAYVYSTSTTNEIYYGGGSSSQNAATRHVWNTAANGTTVAGTERMSLQSSGELWIGYTVDQGAYLLQVNSQIFATNATIATSDGRFKTDVQPVREGLAAVKALQPVQFRWKKHPVHNFIDGTDVGFIAQDVRAALTGRDYTGAVVTQNGSGESEFLGMADSKLIPLLVAAVQELSAEVNALKAH